MCLSTTNRINSFFVLDKKVSIVGKGQLQVPLSVGKTDKVKNSNFSFNKKSYVDDILK